MCVNQAIPNYNTGTRQVQKISSWIMRRFVSLLPPYRPDDEVTKTSETSVNFYQNTRRSNPEVNHLHTLYRENRKSHQVIFFLFLSQ
jgi:hypothetical protein